MKDLILVGTPNSYFTQKAKSYLIWRKVPFVEAPPTVQIFGEFLLKEVLVRQIPVLVDTNHNRNIFDTSSIIDYCEANYRNGGRSVHAKGATQAFFGFIIETFADTWMTLPAMHHRWSHKEQTNFCKADFGQLYPTMSPTKREKIALNGNMKIFSGFLPVLGVSKETIPQIEVVYEELLVALSAHLHDHDFLFGSSPTLADFSFAGPMYAHLLRDPIPGQHMKLNHPHVAHWLERLLGMSPMREGKAWVVRDGTLVQIPCEVLAKSDALYDDDAIPDTLKKVVSLIFREQFPNHRNTLAITLDYVNGSADLRSGKKPLRRAVKMHPFKVGSATGKKMIYPMDLWKLHRAKAHLMSCSDKEKAQVAARCSEVEHGEGVVSLVTALPKLYLYEGTKLYTAEQNNAKL